LKEKNVLSVQKHILVDLKSLKADVNHGLEDEPEVDLLALKKCREGGEGSGGGGDELLIIFCLA
jgi:hypothetical protein